MGIYIKDMKMPTRCIACRLNYDSCACILTGSRFYKYNTEFDPGEERLSDCPLIPIPSHGDLIERDGLIVSTAVPLDGKPYQYVHIDNIKDAPVVIPAET